MPRLIPFLLLVTAVGACSNDDPFAPAAAEQPSLSAQPAGGDAEIAAVAAAVEAAWAAKDAAAYGALYADEVSFIQPTGFHVSGRATVQAQHAGLFAGPGAQSSLDATIHRIVFLTGTVAMVDLSLAYTGFTALAPGLRATSAGLLLSQVRWILVNRGGEWRIVGQQMTPVPPAS
ncbi:MAG TPA: SgcJ/EcaC family oxidoreductase [Gemmatimonadales bacterium]|nr:SgcJ/EcaC family oxidoreductase [Gemmatimonadales bacterium]